MGEDSQAGDGGRGSVGSYSGGHSFSSGYLARFFRKSPAPRYAGLSDSCCPSNERITVHGLVAGGIAACLSHPRL